MASNTLEILIKVSAGKAAAELKKLDGNIEKLGKTSNQSFAGMATNALKAVGGIAAVGTAVYKAGQFVSGAIDDWMAYSEEIRKLSIATGALPEDLSKLMQYADDLGVSMGSLQTAFKILAKNGIQPSVASLGQLSDQILAIQDPTERSAEMARLFGRQWAEIAPLVLAGSDAINAGTAAISDSLIVTQESIAVTDEYRQNVDAVTDAWTGFKNEIAMGVLPALNDAASEVMSSMESFKEMNRLTEIVRNLGTAERITTKETIALTNEIYKIHQTTKDYSGVQDRVNILLGEYNTIGKDMNEVLRYIAINSQAAAGGLSDLGGSAEQATGSAWELSDAYKSVAEGISAANKATERSIGLQVDAKTSFNIPDIAGELENWVKSNKWNAAGGNVLQQFTVDILPNLLPLPADAQNSILRDLGALSLAVEVEIGEIDQESAQRALSDAFGGTPGEAKADIEAAMAVDQTSSGNIEKFLSEQDYSALIMPILDDTQMGKNEDTLAEPVDTPINPVLDESAANAIRSRLSAPIRVQIIPVGGGGNNRNTGSATGPGGNNPGPRPSGGKGAVGLNMIVPPGYPSDNYPIYAKSGERVMVQTPAQQKQNQPVSIVNNYNITVAEALNVRELARQVTREQQRTGVT